MQKILKPLLAGLPLALLASCSADAPDSGDNTIADKSETRYLKVNLVNANGGTRAIGDTPETDYANGTDAENKIRTVDFYLYDADKNYHSHVPMGLTSAVDPINPTPRTAGHKTLSTWILRGQRTHQSGSGRENAPVRDMYHQRGAYRELL